MGNASGNMANIGNLVSDQEEKYIRELCETEKRIRQLESVISDLNFELEKIDLAETTGSVGVTVKTGAENSRASTAARDSHSLFDVQTSAINGTFSPELEKNTNY